jgi:hypothetical protein
MNFEYATETFSIVSCSTRAWTSSYWTATLRPVNDATEVAFLV